MKNEHIQKAREILQKHMPNRFPKNNAYIRAMIEFAKYYDNISKTKN